MTNALRGALVFSGMLFAASPSSSNFTLKAYDIGTGGGSGSSTNFRLNGTLGSQSSSPNSSTNYVINSGEKPTQHANVPPAPTLTNPSSEYVRLRLVLNTGGNPSDTRYNIAISSDNFATTLYVQTDNSIGAGLSVSNYQTYASWGGASGFWITGLLPATTYKVKVRALQGNFSGSPYGPETAGVATVQPSISFSVATSLTSTPPFDLTFTNLSAGVVTDANATAIATVSSNAMHGGTIYMHDTNTGLASARASFTIASSTNDLSSIPRGYGARVTGVSQVGGGPLTAAAPFNGAANNVGGLSPTPQPIGTIPSAITTGVLTTTLKAKSDLTVPAATDYTDTLTFIAAMSF